jgi:hypothetical protein
MYPHFSISVSFCLGFFQQDAWVTIRALVSSLGALGERTGDRHVGNLLRWCFSIEDEGSMSEVSHPTAST